MHRWLLKVSAWLWTISYLWTQVSLCLSEEKDQEGTVMLAG